MYTMRRITMTGRLTRDPELKELTSKQDESKKLKRLTFGVANNDNGKSKCFKRMIITSRNKL